MLKIEKISVGQMKSNCYIVYDTNLQNALVIDAGDDADFIVNKLSLLGVDPLKIIATHGHFDHNMAAYELQKGYGIPYLISEKDIFLLKKMQVSAKHFLKVDVVKAPESDAFLKKDQKISFSDSFFEVIEVPGHTPGSIALYNPYEALVFSGDLIFRNAAIGRYDFSYSNKNDLLQSLEKILDLPDETIIYPGHGEITTVKDEKYLQ